MAARRAFLSAVIALASLAAAACSGSDAVIFTNSLLAAGAAIDPPLMQAVDGIPGWKRLGPPERFNREGLYGHIDGGAEIVLQYGFRELSVFKLRPAAAPDGSKEVVLEIYRMASGEAAFGLYSIKLEGGEAGWPGVRSDNWISPGQANLVKGDFLVNILAPECTDREIGEFLAALEPKVPGRGTVRPGGMERLPREGLVPSSGRYILGPLAAENESPFLEGDLWGFAGAPGQRNATRAYSAKYGAAPAVSKLVVVELGKDVSGEALDEGVSALFKAYFQDVRREGDRLEGRNQAGRWFLFERRGTIAALVLGDPDQEAARSRLDAAISLGAC